jgi:hypothetical protein|tara:strand:+ start:1058 stop:1435 length:378 start_codon:yes stop_codon:yes gene_type:complete
MAITNVQLAFDNVNVSAQVGDIVYYTHGGNPAGGFNQASLANTIRLGPIIAMNGNTITVQYDDLDVGSGPVLLSPSVGSFISFAKDKKANTSSLLGYYMSVNFVNDSKEKAELFSVGSEIVESSK